MGRIIAIDYGLKRVGIAVTDPLRIIATPLTTVANNEVITFFKNYFQQEKVLLIVVGMPKRLSNQAMPMTEGSKKIYRYIKKKISYLSCCYT